MIDWLILIVIALPLAYLYASAWSHETERTRKISTHRAMLDAHIAKRRTEARTMFRFLFPPRCECQQCARSRANLGVRR